MFKLNTSILNKALELKHCASAGKWIVTGGYELLS